MVCVLNTGTVDLDIKIRKGKFTSHEKSIGVFLSALFECYLLASFLLILLLLVVVVPMACAGECANVTGGEHLSSRNQAFIDRKAFSSVTPA